MSFKTSTKRQVVVGHQNYINQTTGEVIECQVVEVEDRDFNFDKIWIWWLAQALDLLGNAKIQVLNYLIEKRDKENRVISTQRNLAKNIGVSLSTVSKTLTALQEIDAIQSPQSGVYVINPNFIFKGRQSSRMRVLMDYRDLAKEEEEEEINTQSAAAE